MEDDLTFLGEWKTTSFFWTWKTTSILHKYNHTFILHKYDHKFLKRKTTYIIFVNGRQLNCFVNGRRLIIFCKWKMINIGNFFVGATWKLFTPLMSYDKRYQKQSRSQSEPCMSTVILNIWFLGLWTLIIVLNVPKIYTPDIVFLNIWNTPDIFFILI